MNQLTKMFDGQQLRIIEQNNEPWFVAKDVCRILEINNSRQALTRLDSDEKAGVTLNDGSQNRHMQAVNEFGLYNLVLSSRKPEAKQFKRWITHEVIPSIRKHGAYMTPETIEQVLTDPDTIIRLATNLKDERLKRERAERVLQQQKPKVVFAESCLASQDSVLVKDVAKLASNQGVKIGQNRLYNKLRDWGYIQKRNTQPTQRAIEAGYFEILQRNIQTPDGSKLTRTTKVTTKGQLQILNRLKSEQEQEVI